MVKSPPIAIGTNNGSYRIINAVYLQLMKDAINVNINIKHSYNLSQALHALQNSNIGLVLTSNDNPETLNTSFVSSKLLFSAYPKLVTLRSNGMERFYILDRPVRQAISKNYPSEKFIKPIFKHAKIASYENNHEALLSVISGKNEYFLGDNISSKFIISRDFYQKMILIITGDQPRKAVILLPVKTNLILLKSLIILSSH